jgi:hypothetical protein
VLTDYLYNLGHYYFSLLYLALDILDSTDPVAMWHVKTDIAPAILLVVDFGGWYKLDSQSMKNGTVPERIQHTQVSLIKDVIVPYTHLLPTLPISESTTIRHILLYFKGAKHRHRVRLPLPNLHMLFCTKSK